MPIKLPTQLDTFSFIAGTHQVERLPCNTTDIESTYKGTAKLPNPYADGHLRAIHYMFTKLVGKQDFPVKEPKVLTNRYKSDAALTWLKELQTTMLIPLVSHPMLADNPTTPQRQFLGIWRPLPTFNTFSVAPHPEIIPKLMHLWLLEIATLNTEVQPHLDLAYGITKEKAHQLEQTAYNASLFIACTQPFQDANNRLGRLVENTLRLHWHLNWKSCSKDLQHDQYVKDLVEYQKKQLPSYIHRIRKLDAF